MNRAIPIAFAFWIPAVSLGTEATIPAGTHLGARTIEPVSSHERVGTHFKAELEQAVVVKGNVLVPVGTRVAGVVEASLRGRPPSDALRVNLTAILINGRSVPIQTTGGYRLDRFRSKRGVSVSGREWNFP